MLRIQCTSTRRFLKCRKNFYDKQPRRNLSGLHRSPNPLVFTAAATTLTAGATIAYIRSDEKFRNQVKSNLPSFLAQNQWVKSVIKDSEESSIESSSDLSLPFQKQEAVLDAPPLELTLTADEEVSEFGGASDAAVTDVVAEQSETSEVDNIQELVADLSNEQDNNTPVLETATTSEDVIEPTQAIDKIEAAPQAANESTPPPEESEMHGAVHTAINVHELDLSTEPNSESFEGPSTIEEIAAENVEVSVVEAVQEEEVSVSPAIEEVSEPVLEEVVTEVVSEPVAEVASEPVTEEASEPVTEVASEPVTEEATEPVAVEVLEPALEVEAAVEDAPPAETPEVIKEIDDTPPSEVLEVVSEVETKVETEPIVDEAAARAALMAIEEEEAEKAATSAILQAFMSRGHSACEVAIDTGTEAGALADVYVKEVEDLLTKLNVSNEDEVVFAKLEELSEKKEKLIQKAVDLHAIAAKEFAQLDNVLEHVRSSPSYEEFSDAETYLIKLKQVLHESTTFINEKIDEVTSYNRVLNFYRKIVGFEPVSFIQMPEEELNLASANLKPSEMRRIIGFLRDYLEQLKNDIVTERQNFNDKLQEELEAACKVTESKVREIMNEQLATQIAEAQAQFELQTSEKQNIHEDEIKHQLKRQAAAHVLHLTDALKYMQDQLEVEHKEVLKQKMEEQAKMFEETVSSLKDKYDTEIRELNHDYAVKLSAAKARLEGFELSVDVKTEFDNYLRNANKLAVACGALEGVIKSNSADTEKPCSISQELERVLEASQGDPTLEAIIQQIPEEVVSDGVFTETALRASFKNMSKLCCRLSLVSDDHHSIFTYALSYIKSFLTVASDEEVPPKSVDADELDVFRIVSYANYCLQRGEVEQAARFVNQLKGEPRTVADGWLREVRLYLETIHAIDALSALSNAVIVGAQQSQK